MRKNIKSIIAIALCLCLCTSLVMPVSAANTEGISYTAVAEYDSTNQSAIVTVTANKACTLSTIQFDVVVPDGWSVTNIASTDASYKMSDYNNGAFGWDTDDASDTSVTNIATITYSVSEGTSGDVTVGINNLKFYNTFGTVTVEDGANVTTTLTITDSASGGETSGYAVALSGNSQNASPVRVGNTILVDITVDDDFAATEMNITYDKDLVSLAETGHTLGTATLKDDNNGKVALADYGADKTGGTVSYTLAFTANADGNAEFGISDDSRGFGTGDSAATANLTKAAQTTPVTITIAKKLYTVTLPNIFITDNNVTTVEDGGEFTFKPENVNYDYANVSVTGTYTELVTNTDGTWTIKGVGSDLNVSGSRTAKTFAIAWEGNAKDEEGVTKPTGDATYGTPIVITVPADQSASAGVDGWYYSVTAKYTESGETVAVDKNGTTHTIAGDAITAALTITITKNTSNFTDVTITLENATDVSIKNVEGNTTTVEKGTEVTLVLDRKEGYTYVINVNNEDKTTEFSDDNEYTFAANENVTVTVTKTVDITGAEAAKYVKLDGADMWLVKVSPKLTNSHYTYDGAAMFWSEQYQANCVLVIVTEGTYTVDTTEFAVVSGAATTVDYSGDVNMADPEGSSVTIDANDAQLVYNMYNAKYSSFSDTVTMEKFLRADMSTTPVEGVDYMINVNDAATIINKILNPNT